MKYEGHIGTFSVGNNSSFCTKDDCTIYFDPDAIILNLFGNSCNVDIYVDIKPIIIDITVSNYSTSLRWGYLKDEIYKYLIANIPNKDNKFSFEEIDFDEFLQILSRLVIKLRRLFESVMYPDFSDINN